MEQRVLMETMAQVRRMGVLLNEVLDLSRQMAEVLDRGDQVVVRMYMSMRGESIQKLHAADRTLKSQKKHLGPAEQRRWAQLLEGAPAASSEEEPLAAQVAANRRIYQQVMDLDRVLNRKVTRDKSIYQ